MRMNGYSNVASSSYESQDDLISGNISLVKRIAHHLAARLPESVELDDLMQAGMIGLLEAASNFDASRGASFDTYAGIRIRGSMLDEVRKQDWTPRSVYRKQREVSEMIRSIEAETGRPAEAREVATGLGISLQEYFEILRDTAGCRLFSLDETQDESGYGREIPSSSTATPDQELNHVQQKQKITDAILKLPEREQLVLSLYYERELNLKEIGEVLGVSESRVCQIHSQAALRLRSMVSN
jgi:RNA polymerase sigma factor for flagellar operon FliA